MAVDIETYRCRIGCFRHNNGTDVATINVTVNVATGSRTLCMMVCLLLAALAIVWNVPFRADGFLDTFISLDVKTTVGFVSSILWICSGKVGLHKQLIGAVTFIRLLLLAAGVEPNPGPECQLWEAISSHEQRYNYQPVYMVLLLSAIFVQINLTLDSTDYKLSDERPHFDINGKVESIAQTFSLAIQRTCSFLLGNKGAHMINGNPHAQGDVSLNPSTLDLLERRVQASVGYISILNLDINGTGFRVGDCYLMTAYHVLRDKIEDLIDNLVQDMNKSPEELKLILEVESSESIKESRDVVKVFLKKHAVDTTFLMKCLHGNVSGRFKTNETASWMENCVVDFLDDKNNLKRFSMDWRIPFGCAETDILILKLIDSTNELTIPDQLFLAERFDIPDKAFIVRFIAEDKQKIILDQECELFKDNDALTRDASSAIEWWESHFPDEFKASYYKECMKSYDNDTGRIILRAAASFIEGSSGSPLVYFNRQGFVTIGAIYQRGFPQFYYSKKGYWDMKIATKSRRPINKEYLFEGCTTMQKLAEQLMNNNKIDLKENIFNEETANRQFKQEKVIADIRRNRENDILFDKLKISADSPNIQLQDVISRSMGPSQPTKVMKIIVEKWKEHVVIDTKVTSYVYKRIRDSNIVTIVGSAGSGKSIAMHYAALELQKEGYSLFVVKFCSEVLHYINTGQGKQLFLIDDPIGEDEIDNKKVREWRSESEHIKTCLTGATKLMVTIRKEILKASTYLVSGLVFGNSQIDIQSKELRMMSFERQGYFCKAVLNSNLMPHYSFHTITLIKECKLPNFPLLVHMFCTDKYFQEHPLEIFHDPLAAFEIRFQRMWEDNKEQFCGLALLAVNNGEMSLDTFDRFGDEITEEVQNAKKLLNDFDLRCSLPSIGDQLDKLDGIYLEKSTDCYTFKHREFQSLVNYVVGKRYRGFTMRFCDTEFILKRCKLSRQSVNAYSLLMYHEDNYGTTGCKYKITIPQSSEKCLASSFLLAIQKNNDIGSKVFVSDFCQDEKFLRTLCEEIETLDIDEENRGMIQYQILCNACLNNFTDFITSLPGVDEEMKRSFTGLTPLMACAYAGNEDLLKRFLDRKCNVVLEYNGYTPLGFAVLNEQCTTVNVLLSRHCDVNKGYKTPLSIASSLGNEYLVTILLEHGADINKLAGDGNSALAFAICNENIVRLLLQHSADINKCGTQITSKTPLQFACCEGNQAVVKVLLDNDADVNYLDSMGFTALTASIVVGQTSTARLLIDHVKTDVDLQGIGMIAMAPLHAACMRGLLDIVKVLLDKHADINQCNGAGLTPLFVCIAMNKYEISDFILKKGADINVCGEDNYSLTPLTNACISGSITTVKYLLDKGANVNKCDGSGMSALSRALHQENVSVAKFLIQHKANVNVYGKGVDAFTPLTVCCFKGSKDMVDLLLCYNVDINKCDGMGNSPLTWAISHDNMNIVQLLLKQTGLNVNVCGNSIKTYPSPTTTNIENNNFDFHKMIDTSISKESLSSEGNVFDSLARLFFNKEDISSLLPTNTNTDTESTKKATTLHGGSALFWAIWKKKDAVIKVLLDMKADVNICSNNIYSPLTAACSTGSVENVKTLLRYKADINMYDGFGYTALTMATKVCQKEVIEALLENNADVNICSKTEEAVPPIIYASCYGSKAIVTHLLDKGADINILDGFGRTALSIAILNEKTEVVKELVKRGADVNRCGESNRAFCPLTVACFTGSKDIVQLLFENKVDVNIHDGSGNSSLSWSILKNYYEITDLLLERGADVNICGEGENASTTLTNAIGNGSVENVKLLLRYGADIEKHDGEGNTPLIFATNCNNIDIINLLLKQNVDVNNCSKNERSTTALIMASFNGFKDIVNILLDNLADINKIDGWGRTALSWAVICNKSEVVNILLERNASVNICGDSEKAYTPLTAACLFGYKDIVQLLLQCQADIDMMDGWGRLPLLQAAKKNQIDVLKILLKNKADVNRSWKNEGSVTAFNIGVYLGFPEVVNCFLDIGADINELNKKGITALSEAIMNKKSEVTSILLERGANVNICGEGAHAYTPLTAACFTGVDEIIVLLLRYNPDINKHDGYGRIPLILAGTNGNTCAVKILLDNGADVNTLNAEGRTTLSDAILNNKSEVVKILLKYEANVNVCGEGVNAYSPLTAASYIGSEDNVKLLLKYNADINIYDGSGRQPLLLAAEKNHLEVIKILFKHNADANVSWQKEEGLTPLVLGVSFGFLEVVHCLLENGADINKLDGLGQTVLTWAIMDKANETITVLLENGADVNFCGKGQKAFTPLTAASYIGSEDNVKLLLKYNADISIYDGWGRQPLLLAAEKNHLEVIKILFKHNADANVSWQKEEALTPLIVGVSFGFLEVVDCLLENGADINKLDGIGRSALSQAISKNNYDIIDLLLKRGADSNLQCKGTNSLSPLTFAVSTGSVEVVKLLLRYKADINKLDGLGQTALTWAIMHKANETITVLLENGADVNFCGKGQKAFTPLTAASYIGSEDNVKLLLKYNADISIYDGWGRQPLLLAAEKNHLEVIKILFKHNADANVSWQKEEALTPLIVGVSFGFLEVVDCLLENGADINKLDGIGRSALSQAISKNNYDIFDLLLKRGADSNLQCKGTNSLSPLTFAVSTGSVEVVKLLLRYKADINKLDGLGQTALTWAIMHKANETITVLLENGADVNFCGKGQKAFTPLTAASYIGSEDNVKLLLKYNADISIYDGWGRQPLLLAAEKNHLEVIKILFKHNADANVSWQKEEALTPLIVGVSFGFLEVVDCLLENGADINKLDGIGRSALSQAISKNNYDIIDLLLKRGADSNLQCKGTNSLSPLTFAVSTGSVEVVKLLLRYKADINKLDGLGQTALTWAIMHKANETITVLLENGADVNFCGKGQKAFTPLTAASYIGSEDNVKLLLKYNADISIYDGWGRQPLLLAAEKNHLEVIKILFKHNADANVSWQKEEALTPLIVGVSFGFLEVVDCLLENGADINKLDGIGRSALSQAISKNNYDIFDLLLKRGADSNLQCKGTNSLSPLTFAVSTGSVEVVKLLLRYKADINKLDGLGQTALTWAIMHKANETITVLLENGADVNFCGKGQKAFTPLTAASYIGSEDNVKLLLKYNADISIYDGWGRQPLLLAAEKNHLEVIKILFKHNADANVSWQKEEALTPLIVGVSFGFLEVVDCLLENGADINKLDGIGRSALSQAISKNNYDIFDLLLKRGADSNLQCKGTNSLSPLTFAVSTGSVEVVKLLLRYKADINKLDGLGQTALTWAIMHKANETITVLLENGADVNFCGKGQKAFTPLTAASYIGSEDNVKLLLKYNADISIYDGWGRQPLLLAAEKNHLEVIKILFKHNADANVSWQKEEALTPLIVGVSFGFLEVVDCLLENGADINKLDGIGRSALSQAISKNNYDIIDLLLKRGAESNLQCKGTNSLSPLTFAVSTGSVEVVKLLLRYKADINKLDGLGQTALTWAIMHKANETITVLLENGADVNFCGKGQKAFTPLTAASYIGSEDNVKLLLKYNADISIYDGWGRQPLLLAAEKNHLEVIKILFKHNADANVSWQKEEALTPLIVGVSFGFLEVVDCLLENGADINKLDGIGRSALSQAISKNNYDIIDLLLKRGADSNLQCKGTNSLSPLTFAVSTGSVEVVKLLLRYKADINKLDGLGQTALTWAIMHKANETITVLLENGADVNFCGKGQKAFTPLTAASYIGSEDNVKLLLKYNADISIYDGWGRQPLLLAAEKNHLEVIKILFKHNADANVSWQKEEALTPLIVGVSFGFLEVVDCLLENGADINKLDGIGRSALSQAISKNNYDIIDLLLKRGADSNLQCKGTNSLSPLTFAVSTGSVEVVKLLLRYKADINKLDGLGRTALTAAIMQNKSDVVKILLEREADVNLFGKGEQAFSPLNTAIFTESLEMVKLLLSYNADINKNDGCGKTALTFANEKKNPDIIRVLLEKQYQGITIIYDRTA